MNPWLGEKRGHLSHWTTQQWVRRTGRPVDLRQEAWLDGPWAPTTGIGGDSAWARTVAAMTEHIHVYLEGSELHADHPLRLRGRPFLRLHYAMRRT